MMILQGVGHEVPYLGVSYANDPKKGGYMVYAPALDLFEVILLEIFFGKGFCWKRDNEEASCSHCTVCGAGTHGPAANKDKTR